MSLSEEYRSLSADYFLAKRELSDELKELAATVSVSEDFQKMQVYGSSALQHMRFYSDVDAMEVVKLSATSRAAAADEAARLVQQLVSRIEEKGAIFLELKAGVNEQWKAAFDQVVKAREMWEDYIDIPEEGFDSRERFKLELDTLGQNEVVQEYLRDLEDDPIPEWFLNEWSPRVLRESHAPGSFDDQRGGRLRAPRRRLEHRLRTLRWTRQEVSQSFVQLPGAKGRSRRSLADALQTSERVMVDALAWSKSEGIYREVSNVLLFKFKENHMSEWRNLSDKFMPEHDVLKSLVVQVKIYCDQEDPLKASKRLASMLRRILQKSESQECKAFALQQLRELQPVLDAAGDLKLLAVLVDAMLQKPPQLEEHSRTVVDMLKHAKSQRPGIRLSSCIAEPDKLGKELKSASRELAEHVLHAQGGWAVMPLNLTCRTEKDALFLANQILSWLDASSQPKVCLNVKRGDGFWARCLDRVAEHMERMVPAAHPAREPPLWFCPSAGDSEVSAIYRGISQR